MKELAPAQVGNRWSGKTVRRKTSKRNEKGKAKIVDPEMPVLVKASTLPPCLSPEMEAPQLVLEERQSANAVEFPARIRTLKPLTRQLESIESPLESLVSPLESLASPLESLGRPLEPLTKPLEPLAKPLEPLTKPLEPLTKPLEPLAKPLEPLAKPLEHLTKPLQNLTRPVVKREEGIKCKLSSRRKAVARKGKTRKGRVLAEVNSRDEDLNRRGIKRNHQGLVISPVLTEQVLIQSCDHHQPTGIPVIKGKITDALSAIRINYDSDDEEDEDTAIRSCLVICDSKLEKLGDYLLEMDIHDPRFYSPNEGIAESCNYTADLFSFDIVDNSISKTNQDGYSDEVPVESGSHSITPSICSSAESRPASPSFMPPPQLRPPNTLKKRRFKLEGSAKAHSGTVCVPDPLQQAALASIGVHKDLSDLTTRELASNIHALKAGMYYCQQLIKQEINVEQLSKKLQLSGNIKTESGFVMPPPRPVSPDITDLRSVKKGDGSMKSIVKPGKGKDAEDQDYDNHEAAIPILTELIKRKNDCEKEPQYEPKGDEYDLSQGSICMVNLFDKYAEKSRRYKKYQKRVRDLDEEGISRHFHKILKTLHRMVKGGVDSERMDLWNSREKAGGYTVMSQLRNLHAIAPFTETQGNQIITLLEKYFVENTFDRSCDSLTMGEFLTYVLLPEAAIRIYAIVNRRSYHQAESEMRHGATGIND